jgi:FlaA1/EpsC-like NDP-sugar epimerase
VVEEYGIDELIIAIPSAKGDVIRSIISYCQIPSVKIRIVPGLQKILSGDLEVKPRDVLPEDLLGRETVSINEKEVKDYLSGKVVLVTGAGGSIGSSLCRHIVNFGPKEILLFDHNENDVYYLGIEFLTKYPKIKFRTIIGDIKDIGLLKQVFSFYRPQVIFHAAAHKHVPLMEENPEAAIKNNIVGSRNLIYAANHYKVERFILISTDKAVNPTSVMGITKRIAEMILQSKAKVSKTKFMAVRFGNVLGSNGSVVPLFKKQIAEGGPLTLTHPEVKRYFMSVNEAAQLVLQAGAMGKVGEIFVLDMGEQIKILDLAKELVALYGLKVDEDIKIKFIGLRPGEKLYEETLLDSERDKATKEDKIYIAQSDNFDPRVLRRKIKDLERVVNIMDKDKAIKKLREIITV